MKLNITIIGFVITAALASNAYALQITKGKLISHKEWATGVARVKVLPGEITKVAALKRVTTHHNDNGSEFFVSSRAKSFSTVVGQESSVSNNGYVMITNQSNEAEEYLFQSSICVQLKEDTEECVYSQDIYKLDAGGSLFESKKPTLDMTFAQAGVYPVIATSVFEDANGHNLSASVSFASINVS